MSANMEFSVEIGWADRSRVEPDRACRMLFRLIRIAAARMSGELTMPSSEVVVHPYTAPERLRMAPLDELTEVYSFGALLYNMLTGELPFDADNPVDLSLRILESDPEPITTHVPELPAALADVVARALCRDREGRIASLDALARELEPFAGTRYDAPDRVSSRPPPLPLMKAGASSVDATQVLTRTSLTPRPSQLTRAALPARSSLLPSCAASPRSTRALNVTPQAGVPLALRATEAAPPRVGRTSMQAAQWLLGLAMVVVASLFGVAVYHALPSPVARPVGKPWVASSGVRVRAVTSDAAQSEQVPPTGDASSDWTASRR